MTTLIIQKDLISLHINAIWPEWYTFKISAWVFWWFTLIVNIIFDEHAREWWIHFTFKRFLFLFFLLNLLTFIEILSRITSTLPYENEWHSLLRWLLSFHNKYYPFYFSCGFCETNQVVSVFIFNILVNENLACSFSWG